MIIGWAQPSDCSSKCRQEVGRYRHLGRWGNIRGKKGIICATAQCWQGYWIPSLASNSFRRSSVTSENGAGERTGVGYGFAAVGAAGYVLLGSKRRAGSSRTGYPTEWADHVQLGTAILLRPADIINTTRIGIRLGTRDRGINGRHRCNSWIEFRIICPLPLVLPTSL